MAKPANFNRAPERTCRIFLVEDHAAMRKLTREILERLEGFHFCGSSTSGESALEVFETAQPDILVADLSLPGMSGVELIREVKERMPHVHCLILSAHREDRYADRALEAGASICVPKGCPTALTEALDRCRSNDFG